MILDTTFVVDVLRGSVTQERIDELQNENFKVSAITVMEIYEGIHRAEKQESEMEKVDELFEELKIVDFDTDIGKKSGEIKADLLDSGEIIDLEDIIIGSTAREKDEKVITRNKKHFKRIQDLKIEEY